MAPGPPLFLPTPPHSAERGGRRISESLVKAKRQAAGRREEAYRVLIHT
jgi:hypothetical protein